MPPLPAPLAEALAIAQPRAPKRERTRRQLVAAAVQVFSQRGVAAATMQEVAAVAAMASGTVYNHFETKDELLQAVALWLADTLCRRISGSYEQVREGAQRMAIGNRRYLWLAQQSPAWTLLLIDVARAAPQLLASVQQYALADLRLGVRQKSFRVASEAAAMDMISGTVLRGMLSVATGVAPAGHDVALAATVLRGLGMPYEEALAVAKRPLPEFAPLQAQEPAAVPARRVKR